MIRLEKSDVLKRKIRRDDPADLARSNFDLVSEAIKAGKAEESLEFLEYARIESQANNDSYVSTIEYLLTSLASFDEEGLFKFLKPRYEGKMREFLATSRGVEDVLQRCTEAHRRHHGVFTVKEEPERYMATYDPCGSGGRLRRTRSLGTTKKGYPWSWGKAGIPYYCLHCCISWEIAAIELRGYPLRITLIGERPEDPCVHLFYKKPELIPEEYFTRIGKIKDMARIDAHQNGLKRV
jgi:hypothetical protein